jgi:hypothetical protein
LIFLVFLGYCFFPNPFFSHKKTHSPPGLQASKAAFYLENLLKLDRALITMGEIPATAAVIDWKAMVHPGACSGVWTIASTINFLANEDTQELASGYLHSAVMPFVAKKRQAARPPRQVRNEKVMPRIIERDSVFFPLTSAFEYDSAILNMRSGYCGSISPYPLSVVGGGSGPEKMERSSTRISELFGFFAGGCGLLIHGLS